jgi:hypothetical protein
MPSSRAIETFDAIEGAFAPQSLEAAASQFSNKAFGA